MLPECFNSPYAVDQFRNYAEDIPQGETTQLLSSLAQKYKIYIIGARFQRKARMIKFTIHR